MCFSHASGSNGIHWSSRGAWNSGRKGKIAGNESVALTLQDEGDWDGGVLKRFNFLCNTQLGMQHVQDV